ncbi:MAG: T9SS type A sorting domain-containing protein [Bacteroidia bacterium]
MRNSIFLSIFLLSFLSVTAQTWAPLTSGTNRNLHDVCIAGGQTIYAVTSTFYGDQGWGSDIMLRSFDNGNTWDSVQIADVYVQDIAFVNDSVGLASGGMPSCGIAPSVIKTNNKGTNWGGFLSAWTLPFDVGMGYSTTYFWEAEKGYAFGGNWGGRQYKTLDNGTTWTDVKHFHSFNAFPDVHFFNEMNGYVMTDSVTIVHDSLGNVASTTTWGYLYKTTDGCQTWTETAFPNDSLTDIHFPKEEVGYVSAGFHLLKTIDAGSTWNTINLSFSAQQISFINENKGYAVGKEGNIYKTLDGGFTWTLDYTGNFLAIEVKKNQGFAVGKNGSIIRFMTSSATEQATEIAPAFQIFPNPTTDILKIISPTAQTFSVILYDLNGKTILKQKGNTTLSLDIQNLSPQTYLLNVIDEKGKVLQAQKFVKGEE